MNEPLIPLFKEKFFHRKSIDGVAFFGNSVTSYFLGKKFFGGHSSGHTASNDTGLDFVSCLGAEKKGGQTDKHTQILSIIYITHGDLKMRKCF